LVPLLLTSTIAMPSTRQAEARYAQFLEDEVHLAHQLVAAEEQGRGMAGQQTLDAAKHLIGADGYTLGAGNARASEQIRSRRSSVPPDSSNSTSARSETLAAIRMIDAGSETLEAIRRADAGSETLDAIRRIDEASGDRQHQAHQDYRGSTNQVPSSTRRTSAPGDMGQLTMLMAQDRDFTPEDYEILQQLDERSSPIVNGPRPTRPPSSARSHRPSTPSSRGNTSANRNVSSNRGSSRAAQGARRRSSGADTTCCVCMDSQANVVFAPCGHHNVCEVCAGRLSPKICPSCRSPFHTFVKMAGRR